MTENSHIVAINDWKGKFIINESYRAIAGALVEKHSEIQHIFVNAILFVDNTEDKGKHKDKYKNAQIGKIPPKYQEIIYQLTGHTFGYIMEIFKRNIENMSREQIIALIYHELRHINIDGDIKTHDIEDWANMHYLLGPDWATTKKTIPDLLDDKFNWDGITGPRLFDDNKLHVVK